VGPVRVVWSVWLVVELVVKFAAVVELEAVVELIVIVEFEVEVQEAGLADPAASRKEERAK